MQIIVKKIYNAKYIHSSLCWVKPVNFSILANDSMRIFWRHYWAQFLSRLFVQKIRISNLHIVKFATSNTKCPKLKKCDTLHHVCIIFGKNFLLHLIQLKNISKAGYETNKDSYFRHFKTASWILLSRWFGNSEFHSVVRYLSVIR